MGVRIIAEIHHAFFTFIKVEDPKNNGELHHNWIIYYAECPE